VLRLNASEAITAAVGTVGVAIGAIALLGFAGGTHVENWKCGW
jgi:hypothetical protein